MSTVPDITEEEMKVILEIREIMQNIDKALKKLPPHVRQHVVSSIEEFNEQSKSFNFKIESLNNN